MLAGYTLVFSSVLPWCCPLALDLLIVSFVFCTFHFLGCSFLEKLPATEVSSLLRLLCGYALVLATSEKNVTLEKARRQKGATRDGAVKRARKQRLDETAGMLIARLDSRRLITRTLILLSITTGPLGRGRRKFVLYVHLRNDRAIRSGNSPRRCCCLLRLEKRYILAGPSSSISHVSSVPK